MSPIAILFWIWLVVSTTIFIQRRITARGAKGDEAVPGAGPARDRHAERTPPWLAAPAAGEETVVTTAVSDRENDHADAPDARDTPDAPDAGGSPKVVPSNGSATTGSADAEPTATPMPADAPPAASGFRSSIKPTLGIADALSGIKMPCDLAPLTLGSGGFDPDHVDLVTTGVGPGEVAAELTSELERLGFAVRDLGAGEHLADRDGTVVRVKVHDRPRVSVGADGRGFTTAPENGIVVEMTLA